MNWTTPTDIRRQVERLWDRGILLSHLAGEDAEFPRRLVLKKPAGAELSERFQEVREWIAGLVRGAGLYRLEWRTISHRTLGKNEIPAALWLDTPEQAWALIGRSVEARCFAELAEVTGSRHPQLLPWLAKRPLKALEKVSEWRRFLDIIDWLLNHGRSGLYLRQVDIPGVHSKFIEQNRAVLAELLDLVLPEELIEYDAGGVSGFCRRYGFRDKPVRIRFRLLDPQLVLPFGGVDNDITLTSGDFSRLGVPVKTVFVTENEINFLAFPAVAESMVVFGAGYGFDRLAGAKWLKNARIFYWGDIDTHGFAILDQFRHFFPNAQSLLMDRETLLAHRALWGGEEHSEKRELSRLTESESRLYDDIRFQRLEQDVRLEQERIGFDWLQQRLQNISV